MNRFTSLGVGNELNQELEYCIIYRPPRLLTRLLCLHLKKRPLPVEEVAGLIFILYSPLCFSG